MNRRIPFIPSIFLVVLFYSQASSLPTIEGEVFGLYPVTNEVSFFKNVDDAGIDRGETIQVVAINGFKLLTDFTFEFTADFNWRMAARSRDHYIELSLVKPIYNILSVNYQRIYATFEPEPINQFGLRLSF
jgi:hypothetical protein